MNHLSTCGEGLAENAQLPAKLAELTSAMADTLEAHLHSLDLNDENARREQDVYVRLVNEQRRIAALLGRTSEEMQRSRTLPMAAHHPEKLASADAREAFARFVAAEEGLTALLERTLQRDRAMLGEMRHVGE
jgi:hypothetical protein